MRYVLAALLPLALTGVAQAAPPPPPRPPAPPARYTVPVEYHTLDNGLKVVLSPDRTAPVATVAVYYNIGFRIEPKDRTGFAHLFEHMMFQGSGNLGKMEFARLVQAYGGIFNGSTRFDFTNYFEIVPSHSVQTMLWADADRMRGLAINQDNLTNQQGVVKNEVKVNVLNRPYGGFPWVDMPQYANKNWYNAHNFYGDLKDLDAANLDDVQSFFKTYYAPSNAALVVVGDIDPVQTMAWIKQYFGPIPAGKAPAPPDISEPRQEEERHGTKQDAQATRPALAVAWHVPPRNTPQYWAMGLLDQMLVQGKDSRLYQALVQKRGLTGEIGGGINDLGNMFNVNGPTLFTVYLFHDQDKTSAEIVKAIDEEVERLRSQPVDQATLDRAMVKMRSFLYDWVEDSFGFGKADLMASFALFDNDPSRINHLEDEFLKVTPQLLQETAKEYLRPTNRTVLTIEAKAPGATPAGSGE